MGSGCGAGIDHPKSAAPLKANATAHPLSIFSSLSPVELFDDMLSRYSGQFVSVET
jgi:hypothetical protein